MKHLARVCDDSVGFLEKGDFSLAATRQSSQSLSSGLVPSGKFLGGSSVGVVTTVELLKKSGALHVPTADVETPRYEGAELVSVQLHALLQSAFEAVDEFGHVFLEEGGALCFGDREFEFGLSASLLLAQVTEANLRRC